MLTYDLNDPALQYFITYTKFDREINKINYGDKKSMRYYFIKDLIKHYYQQSAELSSELSTQHPQSGGKWIKCRSYARSYANQYVFLPSDPDELVDQLKLLYFEKLGGNDSYLLNEQIIAIVDKLLEYECITTNQHQNILSIFDSTSV